MPTSSTSNYTSIQSPPTACIYGELRYGANGGDPGVAELLLGHSGADASTSHITWDQSDGSFDSGKVSFAFSMPAGGGSSHEDSLAVVGSVTDPIYYSSTTYGAIHAVIITAGVQINASAAFSTLVVQFYKNGTMIETFNLIAGPAVDTTSASNPVAEQILTITPTHSDNDQIFISGAFQMTAPDGTYPDVDDLFGQIFVQTASCSQ